MTEWFVEESRVCSTPGELVWRTSVVAMSKNHSHGQQGVQVTLLPQSGVVEMSFKVELCPVEGKGLSCLLQCQPESQGH